MAQQRRPHDVGLGHIQKRQWDTVDNWRVLAPTEGTLDQGAWWRRHLG